MMVIDVLRHFWRGNQRYHEVHASTETEEAAQARKPDWEETTGELIAEMDAAGVDLSVLLVADYGDRLGTPHFTIDQENAILVQVQRLHPRRVVAFYGIDPRRPGAPERYEQAIKEWGVAGIKLHPTVGYFPHDRACYPIYEICIKYDLPVLFHSGERFHPLLYSRFTHPLEFDQVAVDFPRLTMIMGHAGGEWWADCVTIARGHANMLVDLSEWQTKLRDRPQETLFALDRMRNYLGIERIIWGTDFPHMRQLMSLKDTVEIYRRLPSLGQEHGYQFTEREIDAILGENAARILKLSS